MPRRNLLTSLLALLAMVPFTPWMSTFDGALCFYAAASDAFYGQYILFLALTGLLLAYSERFIPDISVRRIGLAGTGFGALCIIIIDYLQVLEVQNDPMSSWNMTGPGLGMYLGAAIGVALIITALLPCREGVKTLRPSTVRVLRPGSPGSGP